MLHRWGSTFTHNLQFMSFDDSLQMGTLIFQQATLVLVIFLSGIPWKPRQDAGYVAPPAVWRSRGRCEFAENHDTIGLQDGV